MKLRHKAAFVFMVVFSILYALTDVLLNLPKTAGLVVLGGLFGSLLLVAERVLTEGWAIAESDYTKRRK